MGWGKALAALLSILPLAHGQQGNVITTVAGTDWLFPAGDRPALSAPLGGIPGLWPVVDTQGNLFVADADNLMVFRISADGLIHVVAGNGVLGYTGDGGPAANAALEPPTGLTLDAKGNLYVASSTRIRKIDSNGIITTVAGTGASGYSGDAGQATQARFRNIAAIASDPAGNLYLADSGNHRIRKITGAGIVTTIAGNGAAESFSDGPALDRALNSPAGIAVDSQGTVYFTDTTPAVAPATSGNGLLRKVAPGGQLSTLEGPLVEGLDGNRTRLPVGIALDPYGNVYFTDAARSSVYKFSPGAGRSTLVAGLGLSGVSGYSGDGGDATKARLRLTLGGVATDIANNIYIADNGNQRIRKVSSTGIVSTLAGNGGFRYAGDGLAAIGATFYFPFGIAADSAGNVYLSEPERNRVRRIAANGTVSAVAGTGESGFSGDDGPAARAALAGPFGVSADSSGNLYIADALNSRIRRVAPSGTITTVAGTGRFAFSGDGGAARDGELNAPRGIAADSAGNLYIADTDNHRVRRIANGTITTVAGNGTPGFSGDGGAAIAATLNRPVGVAVDSTGAIYIADSGNQRIRRIVNGGIATVAGNGAKGYSGDGGQALQAALSEPSHIAFDRNNAFYIADTGNHRVRRVSNGVITTFAGSAATGYSGDGGPAASAALFGPSSIVFDASGNLLIADQANHRVRAVLAGIPTIRTTPAEISYFAIPGDTQTVTKSLYVAGSIPGIPFAAGGNRNWLSVSPAAGVTPATVQVTVDPAKIDGSITDGTVSITAPGTSTGSLTAAVKVELGLGGDAELAFEGESLEFSLFAAASASTQIVVVSNSGAEPAEFGVASENAAWLRVTPESGRVPGHGKVALQVTADPAALAVGTYRGGLRLTETASGDSSSLAVTATVSPAQSSIFLTESGLTFTAVAEGSVTPPQPVGVVNLGRGNMNWRATASGVDGPANWLKVSPESGTSGPGGASVPEFTVTASSAGLAPGDYYAQVRVTATDADNSPQSVLVVLTVLPAGSTPTPIPLPSTLIFTSPFGSGSPSSQTVTVTNLTNRNYSFTSGRATAEGSAWLTHIPAAGAIAGGGSTRLVVQPLATGLGPGVYRGSITLLFDTGTPRTVNVVLIVAGVSGTAPANSSTRFAGECGATKLVPVFTSIGSEIAVPAGWPQRLVVRVLDDCGRPMTEGKVSSQFSGNIPPLNLTSLKDGTWTGTWQSRTDKSPTITVKVQAELPDQQLRGTAELTSTIRVSSEPPALDKAAVFNAASRAAGAPLAPGTLVTISGANLASGAATAGFPLPTRLAGTLAAIGDKLLPLVEVADNQVSAVVPYDVPVNTRTQLIVQRGPALAVPETVTLAPTQPAIFTVDRSGAGAGTIFKVNADGSQTQVSADAPVTAGDTIAVLATGLGAVDPAVAAGDAALDPPSKVMAPVSLSIGGVAAEVSLAALQPGVSGVYRIVAIVPATAPAGDAVPVVLTAGTQSSPAVGLAVR